METLNKLPEDKWLVSVRATTQTRFELIDQIKRKTFFPPLIGLNDAKQVKLKKKAAL